MADIAIFRINYKSDFILTLQSDAGWLTPFCIKFWTGAPSQAYFAGYDGTTYTHCAPVDGDPTKLSVQFDDHHLPIGDLKFQIGYHFTVADFPTSIEDEVINQAAVIIDNDGEQQQVMLDFNGETAPEISFAMPAYANEAQRIANEQARIAAEEQRVSNEEGRISAEESRQEHEQQRIHNEETRIAEFASLKADAIEATGAANDAATLANEKAQLAADKAALAQAAATLANDKAQLAADKAALAQAAATLANDKAALAQQKADYAQAQGDYAKAQGDIALADHERAETDHERAEADHDTATDDHTTATSDHTQAESDHTRAESDHTTAASDHTQASSDHDRAESDHTKAGQDHDRAESDHTTAAADHTRAESDHAAVEAYVDSLGAFDISAYHATSNVLAKYADLTAALGTNGANVPDALRKGGMSVKFVLSSDNNYVQFRYMSSSTAAATFTNVNNWQGVDIEPTAGSKNLVESGGVFNDINSLRTDNLTIKDGNTDIPPVLIGYALYSTGEPITNIYLANFGVTDFIPVGSNDTVKIVSGVMQAGTTNYPYIAFYNASKEKLSVKSVATAGEITNTEEIIPEGAIYFRLTTANDAPAVIDYKGEIVKAIEDLQGDVADLYNTVDTSLSDLQEDVDECRDLLGLNSVVKAKCAAGLEGYILKTDGTVYSSVYTTAYGVTDFIPVTAGDSFVLSGARCGSTGYAYLCFYSSASESGFVSEKHTTQGPVDNVSVTVPNGATYVRISLQNKTVPATLDYGIEPVNVVELKEEVDEGFEGLSDTKLFFDLSRQMYNPSLPIKGINEELNILYIGSSYGVDTITALVDICKNVGLKVVTGDMYKSGGTTAQYLDDLANNRTNTIYYNYYNKDSATYLRKVDAVVKVRPWDVIIVQDSSVRLATKTVGYDKNFVKWISALREMCTNPRVVFAFNATWVHADSMDKQTIAYQESYKLMQQSGIDIAIPSGAAIEYLRQTDVNDGNNIYRDSLHLDTGVGRFTAACSLFFAIVNYVYGVGLDNCTLTGKWDVQGSPVSTNPTIEVTDANRDTCIACAKKAITNRFMLPTE